MPGVDSLHSLIIGACGTNLQGEGSKLFWTALTVLGWIRDVFSPFPRVKSTIENVASMDRSARLQISAELDTVPIKLDPSDTLPYNRPRLAWCSEELTAMEGLTLWEEQEFYRAYVTSEGVSPQQWIRPGWSWPAADTGTRFPTFMKSIERRQPPPAPAGLAKCDAPTIQRWRLSSYKYPPYQFGADYLLTAEGEEPRVLDASERDVLLGYGPGHTKSCMAASEAKQSWAKFESARCSLCGDSFAIPSFAIMGAVMCRWSHV